jgi:hypothetical protein
MNLSALFVSSISLFGPVVAEIIYFLNCGGIYSEMVVSVSATPRVEIQYSADHARQYYEDDRWSYNQEIPPDEDRYRWDHLVRWEDDVSATFPTGVTVHTSIDNDAAGFEPGQYAGYAVNRYQTFICGKDDNWAMYTTGSGFTCESIYYCVVCGHTL